VTDGDQARWTAVDAFSNRLLLPLDPDLEAAVAGNAGAGAARVSRRAERR
jgi:hypothetical protein